MKIRQEISLMNSPISGAGAGSGVLVRPTGRFPIFPYDYTSGLFYIEALGTGTTGATGGYFEIRHILGAEGNTVITGVPYSELSASGFYRSPIYFTGMASGGRWYDAQCEYPGAGQSFSLKALKLVVLQEAPEIFSTISRFDIGTTETQQSTTVVPQSNPKYWKYDSGAWPTHTVFCAYITYFRSSDMSTSDFYLQSDGGSGLGAFANVRTLAGLVTNISQVTSVQTLLPVHGHTYRIASLDSDTMNGTHTITAAHITAQVMGSGTYLNIPFTTSNNGLREVWGGTASSETNQEAGQSFTTDGFWSFSYVSIVIVRQSSPTDNIWLDLMSGSTTGTLLSRASMVMNNAIPNTRRHVLFKFPDSISLNSGEKYYLLCRRSGGRNTANNYGVQYSTNSVYANGGLLFKDNNVWGESATSDVQMMIFKDGPLTGFESEYEVINQPGFGSSTGLKGFQTYFDPNQWDANLGTLTYYHEANGAISGTADLKLQSNPLVSPTDITNSTITDCVLVERSSEITMPTSATLIDSNVMGTGTLNCSRIIIKYSYVSGSAPGESPTVLQRRRIFICG